MGEGPEIDGPGGKAGEGQHLEDEEGVVVLSKKKADFLRVWEKSKTACEENEKVPGMLTRKIKGGVTVDLMGVDAFLPGSQIALRRVPNIEDLIGQTFDFKIIKLNKRRRNIVVSRRAVLEETRAEQRSGLIQSLAEGQVIEGVVKNITDYGVFVDLGGVDGLLHVTDIAWRRINHPSEALHIGQNVKVQVIRFNPETQRISLGMKQLEADPWEGVELKYPAGARFKGRVTNITDYGAFVELEPGIEGSPALRLGLRLVKGLSGKAVQRLLEARRLASRNARWSSGGTGSFPAFAAVAWSASSRSRPRRSRLESRRSSHSTARTSSRVCTSAHARSVSSASSTRSNAAERSSSGRHQIQLSWRRPSGASSGRAPSQAIGTIRFPRSSACRSSPSE